MKYNLTKTMSDLAPLQISDFVAADFNTIKGIAANSNGEFLKDRTGLPAAEFFTKYFPGYEVLDTVEKQEIRNRLQREAQPKVRKAKVERDPILDQYGDYIVTLWESGNEFTVSYRKTTTMITQWNILSKNEVEYKVDGRRFSVVLHSNSRKDALAKKNALYDEMIGRGMSYKGDLPV
jgi:hypothetical protein